MPALGTLKTGIAKPFPPSESPSQPMINSWASVCAEAPTTRECVG